jgi:protoheme IX farnesyltransferase
MKNNSGSSIKNYLELGKIKIMLPVSLTGFTGYFLYSPSISPGIILSTLGILLLAIASAALNQVQERDLDSRMNRTHNRPLPAGKITVRNASIFFAFNLLSGLVILYTAGNITAALLGIFTIIWYNGVYTFSKRYTPFAVVPGSLTGALPPVIGWTAAGGYLFDQPVLLLGFLIFIGQVPHFWLLIMKYGEEYEKAGIPSLTRIFRPEQINRLTFTWVAVSVISAFFLVFSGMIRIPLIIVILSTASVYLVFKFSDLLRKKYKYISYTRYFILLNSYFLLILVLLISDRIINA